MHTVALKERPELLKIIKLVDPKFRKQNAFLHRQTTEVRLSGTYWDEGSRSSYYLVNLDTNQVVALDHCSPPQFGGPKEDPVQHLQPGFAIVEMGVFCGKPATPSIYLHPEA